jgi:hypothetical protein
MTSKRKTVRVLAWSIAGVLLAATLFVFWPPTANDFKFTLTTDSQPKYFAGDRVNITAKVEVKRWLAWPVIFEMHRVHRNPVTNEVQADEGAGSVQGSGPVLDLSTTRPLGPGDNEMQLTVFTAQGNPIASSKPLVFHAYQTSLPAECPLKQFNALEPGTKLIAAPGFDFFDIKPKAWSKDCTMGYPNSDVFVPLKYSVLTKQEWAAAKAKGTPIKLGLGELDAITYVSHFDELFGDVTVTAINYHGILIQSWATSKAIHQIEIDAVKVR